MEDLKGSTIRGGATKLCGQALTFGIRLGFIMVMSRLLEPEDFGLVAMATIVTGIFELFATAGLSAATVQKFSITNEQISTLFWINVLVGAMLSLLCLATAPVLAAFYHEDRLLWVTVVLAAGFLFTGAGVQHFALLQRELRYFTITMIETVAQLGSVAIGIAMAVAGFKYWALVGAAVSLRAIMTACTWASMAWIPAGPSRSVVVGPLLRFGGTITLNNLVIYLGFNLDKVLLGRFWGAEALGLYGRAFQLIDVPTSNLNSAIGGVAFSALSRLQNDHARYKNYFLKGYSVVSALTHPTTLFCVLFAEEIVMVVLGPKWNEAVEIFRLLAPTILVFGVINPTGWLLQSVGLQGRSLRIALVIAPLVAVACVIGLPYGPTGVALAYSITMMLWLVPHVFWSLHNTIVTPAELILAICRPFTASVVAALLTLAVMSYLGQSLSPILRLVLGGGVMASLYALILLFVMGQKSFYYDLIKGLKSTSPSDNRKVWPAQID